MFWEEIPAYWGIKFDSPKILKNAQNQLSGLIIRGYNQKKLITQDEKTKKQAFHILANFYKGYKM